jgi:hypothetical protein
MTCPALTGGAFCSGVHYSRASRTLNLLTLRPILPGMSRKPQPPAPTRWDILYAGKNAKLLLGEVEATDEADAIAKAAEQFKMPASKLIAVKRT